MTFLNAISTALNGIIDELMVSLCEKYTVSYKSVTKVASLSDMVPSPTD